MLRIYVNTWGNYNENGADGGEWITLPMDSDDLEETLERIAENMGDADPEWFVNDHEWGGVYEFGPVAEMSDLEELNDLCETLETLDSWDLEKLEAILEAVTDDLEEALNLVKDAIFYKGMDLEDVAAEIVEECYNLPEFALRYFDYEAFARDLRFDGYTEVKGGVIFSC